MLGSWYHVAESEGAAAMTSDMFLRVLARHAVPRQSTAKWQQRDAQIRTLSTL